MFLLHYHNKRNSSRAKTTKGISKIPGTWGLSETHPVVWQIHPEYFILQPFSVLENYFLERVQEGER